MGGLSTTEPAGDRTPDVDFARQGVVAGEVEIQNWPAVFPSFAAIRLAPHRLPPEADQEVEAALGLELGPMGDGVEVVVGSCEPGKVEGLGHTAAGRPLSRSKGSTRCAESGGLFMARLLDCDAEKGVWGGVFGGRAGATINAWYQTITVNRQAGFDGRILISSRTNVVSQGVGAHVLLRYHGYCRTGREFENEQVVRPTGLGYDSPKKLRQCEPRDDQASSLAD